MKLCGKQVGEGKPTFVIAEAGINHNGSLDAALKMIDVAKECGADAVKFQKRCLSDLYRHAALENPSRESHSLGVYIPILRDCELTEEAHAKLFRHCTEVGIPYLCSPWDIPSAEFLAQLGVDTFKLPSACLSDIFLVERLTKFINVPIIFSTGMHSSEEMMRLLGHHITLAGKDRSAILHCISSYPTANRDVNLGVMRTLRDAFGCPVGYSGHERGIAITTAAVGAGATIIERHFTMDRTWPGPDQAASLEPHGLETLIRHIRAVDEAMGADKLVNRGEMVARETIGKVLTWARDHTACEDINKNSFMATSPGYGMPVWRAFELIHGTHMTAHAVKAGEPVADKDLSRIAK